MITRVNKNDQSIPFPRIRNLRKKLYGTQKNLCDQLGFKVDYYARCERGEQQFRAKDLCQLSNAFHTSVDYLLGYTDEPKCYSK